jgi:hypothetical protein
MLADLGLDIEVSQVWVYNLVIGPGFSDLWTDWDFSFWLGIVNTPWFVGWNFVYAAYFVT